MCHLNGLTDEITLTAEGGATISSDGHNIVICAGANWSNASDGMAWPFAVPVEINSDGWIWAGSPGTGFQKARIPTTTAVSDSHNKSPEGFALEQNFPNPFTPLGRYGGAAGNRSTILSNGVNPETAIRYQLTATSEVELAIFDIRGRRVRTLIRKRQGTSTHRAMWDGRDARGQTVASGIYLYRLVAGGHVQVQRMAVVR